MEPQQQYCSDGSHDQLYVQVTEPLELKESQVIRDLEDAVSKQGHFRSFRRVASVGTRRTAAEHRYIDLQFRECTVAVEKVHCCNGLVAFTPFATTVKAFCVVSCVSEIPYNTERETAL